MITDKNEDFLSKYGSPDVSEKIWNKYKAHSIHPFEHNIVENPFINSSVADDLVDREEVHINHPNVSDEKFNQFVHENSGYGRQQIMKSPKLSVEHLKIMEKKKPLSGSDMFQLARNNDLKEDVIDHILYHGPKIGNRHLNHRAIDDFDINQFAKNKNLQPRHISTFIDIGSDKANYSPTASFANIAIHPNLSKENAHELRTKINHPYINSLLDSRGM